MDDQMDTSAPETSVMAGFASDFSLLAEQWRSREDHYKQKVSNASLTKIEEATEQYNPTAKSSWAQACLVSLSSNPIKSHF
jgi:hypothetical protein